jgi:hypothetical protein
MSQNDFNLANQGFPSMRADMNSAFQALASNSSGATSPATTYAYQWWYDTTTDILKFRNADNDAWIDFATFDQATDSWSFTSVDINGGTIDGTVIGGTTAAAISGTTGSFTSLTVGGNTALTTASDIEAQVKTATNATGTAPIYSCRAWVNFNGTGTIAIRASGNVSSITDFGTGDYGVNFTEAMPDANYSICASANGTGGSAPADNALVAYPWSFGSATAFRMGVSDNNTDSNTDAQHVHVSVFR